MNTQSAINVSEIPTIPTGLRWHKESNILLLIVILINAPLFTGGSTAHWMFSEKTISGGEWWQLLTHPFAHVSWYHLLMDATALFLIYPSLIEPKRSVRLSYLAAAAMGSLLAAMWQRPEINSIGFCGLSGIAHGIMAIWSIELIQAKNQHPWGRRIGILSLITVILKCTWEAITNLPFIGFAHFDLMGTPILICHLGGVAGGILAYGIRIKLGEQEVS